MRGVRDEQIRSTSVRYCPCLLEGLPVKLTELFKLLLVRSVSADVEQGGADANAQTSMPPSSPVKVSGSLQSICKPALGEGHLLPP